MTLLALLLQQKFTAAAMVATGNLNRKESSLRAAFLRLDTKTCAAAAAGFGIWVFNNELAGF